MTALKQYFQVLPASTPDLAVVCPAGGYIPNPILPSDGWNLLCSFQTNSPNSTTFDPIIGASLGQYSWDLGDGTICIGDKSISHTYLTTATRTVKLYGKGTCNITNVSFDGDNIVGILDISNDAFKTLSVISLGTNPTMTKIIFPSVITATVSSLSIFATGITGTLDLTAITKYSTTAALNLYSNATMTGITFASTITGTISNLTMYSCGITGILDLSMMKNWIADTAQIYLYSNSAMTNVTFPSTITTGGFSAIYLFQCNLTGTLNLSMFKTLWSVNGANISAYTNPNLTNVTFPSTITGLLAQLDFHSTGFTGVFDISMFKNYSNVGLVNLSSNPNMTNVTFPTTTITGFIQTLNLSLTGIRSIVDITKLRMDVASLVWQFQNNSWSAAIVNQILYNINSLSTSGFASRNVNVGGTNIDPDTTSGGYDGVAARTALIAKAFTVGIA